MTALRTGTWNLQYGHPIDAKAKAVLAAFERSGLDVFALTEAHDYIDALKVLAEAAGHRLLFVRTRKGSDNNALLVRRGIVVASYWSFVAGTGWSRLGGGWMQPMQPLAAHLVVNGRNLVVVAAHAPVAAWVPKGGVYRWTGAIRRRIAYRGYVSRLKKVFDRTQHPVIVFGDWNAEPTTKGNYSPEWLRAQVGGDFSRPLVSTGHGEIDFAITRGIVTEHCTIDPKAMGSDHRCVEAHQIFADVKAKPAPAWKAPVYPYIKARWFGGPQSSRRVVMHSAVFPCVPGGARKVASFFAREVNKTSAHYVVDPAEVIQCVPDDRVAYHCGYNQDSIGVEMCDMPSPTDPSRWDDTNHRAMEKRAARLVAELCVKHGIRPYFVGVMQLRLGVAGVTTHNNMSKAFRKSTHWDPGAWRRFRFMREVRRQVASIKAGK